MLGDYRRQGIDPYFLQRTGLAFLLIALLLLVANVPAIAGMRFPDPDDTLRLVQVRDLIAGQGWFDLHQHRVDAPHGGVPMHWSRLVDIPLALSILTLTPILGQAGAEAATLILVPLATLAVALLFAGRIAWRLLGEEATGFACLAMAMSVPVVSQLRPMRIDHHGWQIVLALAAANGMMARSPRLGGWAIGVALALWLSISIEGLPLAAAFIGLLALRWLRDPNDRAWLLHAMGGLALTSAVLFLLTRGFSDLETHCDAISPIHLGLFAWGALGVGILAAQRPRPWAFQLIWFGLIAAGAGAMIYLAAPQCAGGGFAGLDPLVKHYWYDNVAEGLPIWRQQVDTMLGIAIPPIVGLYAAVRLTAESRGWLRRFWFDYTFLLACALVVAVLVSRAGAVAAALAAPPLGWQIATWYRGLRRIDRPGKRAAALAALAMVLVPALPFTLATIATPAKAASGAGVAVSKCAMSSAGPGLRRLGGAEVLAPLDISPAILYQSGLTVFATGHHRGNNAMRDTIALFLGPADDAHRMLAARGTQYVALCPDLNEPGEYAHAAPHGLAADLVHGRAPAWLTPVDVGGEGNFRVWKVNR
ncbi:MAG TPA: hypothetical protein VL100_10450 [Croceibacterium sp.]|nr:hypothetical protein [Croceibacterium sp.]